MRAAANIASILLVAASAASPDANCQAEDVSSLLQLEKEASGWNLQGAMADSPPGAYFEVIEPAVEAVSFAYFASSGPEKRNEFVDNKALSPKHSAGGNWIRNKDLELNSEAPGLRAFTFTDVNSEKMIIAFRGACNDPTLSQCRADQCVLLKYKALGDLSEDAFGQKGENNCAKFNTKDLDYLAQAAQLVERAQKQYPRRKVLLTGHQMGGMIANTLAAKDPATLHALTFAPSSHFLALGEHLGVIPDAKELSTTQGKRVVVCDPYDCVINSLQVPNARIGAVSCVYNDEENVEPMDCMGVAALSKDGSYDKTEEKNKVLACKASSGRWKRYMGFLRMTTAAGRPLVTPECKNEYSGNTRELRETLGKQYRD